MRKLTQSKSFRYENGLFVADGMNLVKAAGEKVKCLYVTEKRLGELRDINVPVYAVADKVMEAVSDTESPQGIIALVKMDNKKILKGKPCVVIDGVGDPGNFGTIIRTAACCGIENIILHGGTCDPYSPKAVRASMGGIFGMRFGVELPSVMYALDMDGDNIYGFAPSVSDYGLVVGSEARGISRDIKDAATAIISLPMTDRVESLNAGVSLSVALYELTYGRSAKTGKY